MNILLKSAKIVDASNKRHHLKKRDVFIQKGQIKEIAAKLEPKGNTKEIELRNLHISPGWIDSSVSFGEPGFEERETIANGLLTAAKSGFTDIVLNPNSHPVPDSSGAITFLRNKGASSITRLHPLGTLTVGSKGKDLAELYDMNSAGAVGFYDYKSAIDNPNLLKIALQYAQNFNGLVYSFALDRQIAGQGSVNEGEASTKLGLRGIPNLAEDLQISRDLFILEYTGGKLHIPTISTAKAVRLISDGKKKGLNISCSVAVHNLWFHDDVLQDFDSRNKVMPPIRTQKDAKALVKGLRDGIIDFVTSDHTPIDVEQKRVEFENAHYGSIGLESAFGALNSLLGMERAVDLLSKGRERYAIQNASIAEGNPANITLFNPEGEYVFKNEHILSTSKNSMYEGEKLKGKVYGVIVGEHCML